MILCPQHQNERFKWVADQHVHWKKNDVDAVENRNCLCKVGIADDDAPRVVFASIVDRSNMPSDMVGMEKQDRFVSDESQGKRCVLKFTYQINHDMDDVEKIWP